MGSIGLPELLIVLFVVLLILGPKRLPGLGRSLGGGMREFKDSITGKSKESELTAGSSAPEREALDGEVVPESRR
jgi:sec-independent protein translocase protein TatA